MDFGTRNVYHYKTGQKSMILPAAWCRWAGVGKTVKVTQEGKKLVVEAV